MKKLYGWRGLLLFVIVLVFAICVLFFSRFMHPIGKGFGTPLELFLIFLVVGLGLIFLWMGIEANLLSRRIRRLEQEAHDRQTAQDPRRNPAVLAQSLEDAAKGTR